VVDHNRPRLSYVNDSATAVVVTVELPGDGSSREREVPAGDASDLSLPECEDECSLTVATSEGELLGTVDGPLCPGGLLTITDGLTLEYDPDGRN
jgi:hypothetical protein